MSYLSTKRKVSLLPLCGWALLALSLIATFFGDFPILYVATAFVCGVTSAVMFADIDYKDPSRGFIVFQIASALLCALLCATAIYKLV